MYRPSEKILSHKSGQLQSALNLISPKYLFFYLVFFQKKRYRSFSDRIIAITIKINLKKKQEGKSRLLKSQKNN